jgi:hypothetical protein
MKTIRILFAALIITTFANSIIAQTVKGRLTLNEKSRVDLVMETNSVTALFKEFKTKKYNLGFQFKAYDIPKNCYDETVVFFNFYTRVEKDGKLIKEIKREEPFPYFPGDMFLGPESFDFISILGALDGGAGNNHKILGIMPEGQYAIKLAVIPNGFKGNIIPLEIYFALRKRPTR